MKVRVPVMVQDAALAQHKGIPERENIDLESEFFLDGPVSRQVAVVDFDPTDGVLAEAAAFTPPEDDKVFGEYDARGPIEFQQVSVFGTIHRTIELYQRTDMLGRAIRWAFPGSQILVVPRAGSWANAFYERSSRSLQFFFFEHKNKTVHTSLSRDIVAHEVGHAILDGVAPDLYDSVTPQSLALHECIADLTALLMAFNSRTLREAVLEQTGGSIEHPTAFNMIALEFGTAIKNGRPLRDLVNDASLIAGDGLDLVDKTSPHQLSQVMSGALYPVMQAIHKKLMDAGDTPGKALGIGSLRFGRFVTRALDYLPPGEVSFADYARAIIASDTVSHPDSNVERDVLKDELIRRGVVSDAYELEVPLEIEAPALEGVDRQTLAESDWAAFEFVSNHRDLFSMPEDIPFSLRPRLEAEKQYFHRDGSEFVKELIFKVSWEKEEDNPLGTAFPSTRILTIGTTLAIDWERPVIRARLTHDLTEVQAEQRTKFLRKLIDDGTLIPTRPLTYDQTPSRRVIGAETLGGAMRLHGAAATLHVAGPDAPDLEEA